MLKYNPMVGFGILLLRVRIRSRNEMDANQVRAIETDGTPQGRGLSLMAEALHRHTALVRELTLQFPSPQSTLKRG